MYIEWSTIQKKVINDLEDENLLNKMASFAVNFKAANYFAHWRMHVLLL